MEEAPSGIETEQVASRHVRQEQFILTDCLNGVLFFFLVTVRKRSNTAMATATKIALSRAAQVYRECAGKIFSAATAEWHELNAICQRP